MLGMVLGVASLITVLSIMNGFAAVSGVNEAMQSGTLTDLQQPFSVVLGTGLARGLGVAPGDTLDVTLPSLTVTPLGTFPRSKRLRVVGLFAVNAQPDGYQAYVSLETGRAKAWTVYSCAPST